MNARHLVALSVLGILMLSWSTTLARPSASPPAPLYLPIVGRATSEEVYRGLATSTYDGDSEIYTLRGNGSEVRQLTDNDVTDEQPQWSPDGSQILWVQYSGVFPNRTYDNLWLMNSDGSNARALTQQQGLERGSWSPDGRYIFYYNRAPSKDLYTAYSLYSTTPTATSPTLIAAGTYISNYEWSPNGTQLLLYVGRRDGNGFATDLYTANADGSNYTRVTQNVRRAAWSPDGTWIAFEAVRDGVTNVYRIRPNGSELQPLTTGSVSSEFWGWVEGGARLIVKQMPSEESAGDFYLLDAAGGTPSHFIGSEASDSFIKIEKVAPDGQSVVYSRVTEQGYLYLHWQATNDTTDRAISPFNCASSCGVNAISWSEDGTHLTYSFWQQHVPSTYNTQVYVVDLSNDAAYYLLNGSAFNAMWLPDSHRLAVDAATPDGDPRVRVPHLSDNRPSNLTRIPFIENANFRVSAWRLVAP